MAAHNPPAPKYPRLPGRRVPGRPREEPADQTGLGKASVTPEGCAAVRRRVRRTRAARTRESLCRQCRATGTRTAAGRAELRDKTRRIRSPLVAGAAASGDDARTCRATTPQ